MKSKNKRQSILKIVWIALLTLSTSDLLVGQAGTGGLNGVVTDTTGALIPGATLKLESRATGVVLSASTNGSGLYSFVSLAPSTYQLTVTQSGFETTVQSNVLVTVDQVSRMDIVLHPGAVTQVVTVSESESLIETTNSTVGQLIDEAAIDRVPLLTRNPFELVQLSAGVNPTNGVASAADTQNIVLARPGVNVAAYTINGSTMGSVQFLLDGASINIGENGALTEMPAFQPTLDDVEEYRVETQNTPATYQSAGSGAISIATKAGTNHFHGDAFAYIRPDALAANDYFVKAGQLAAGEPNTPSAFHRYQEGGSIGGPILHRKLFFFADYEATQQALLQTTTLTVPTANERKGDFSADAFTVYNPLVPDLPNGNRQPFSGNIIPQGDLNPVALNMVPWFPLPNQPGVGEYHLNNYFDSGLSPTTNQQFDVRLDEYLGEKQHLYGRYTFGRSFLGMAKLFGDSNAYDVNYFQNILPAQNVLLADDYTLGKNTLLQLRGSFTRHHEDQTGDPRTLGFDITSLGFPGSLASQVAFKQAPYIGFANFTTNAGAGNGDTFLFVSENYDLIAALQSSRGKHEFSVGAEFEKMFMNVGQPGAPTGQYIFDNTGTSSTTFAGDGSDFASFLLGIGQPPGFEGNNFSKDIFGAASNPYYAAYIQDDYHVLHNLTLNVGLRWDIFGGRTERHNRLEYFDPTIQYKVGGVPLTGGEQFVAQGGSSRTPFAINMKDLGPRLSFAWQPVHRLVVQGGGGIYYGPSNHMVNGFGTNSDGFSSVTIWNATTYNQDGNTTILNPLSNPFPGGIVQPIGTANGPATNLGNVVLSVLHSQREITTYNYNFGVEYELPRKVVVAAGFVGSRGLFLPMVVDENQLPLSTIAQYQSTLSNQVPNIWENVFPTTSPFYGQSSVPQFLALEPYPQFNCGGINCGVRITGYPGGDSEYDALQVKLEKRLSSHFTMLAAFTWGKLMTDDSGPTLSYVGYHNGAAQDWKNLKLEHAVSPQDLSYQFTWQASYDLPIGKGRLVNVTGWADHVIGGLTMNAIVYRSSGNPINAPGGTGNPYFNQRTDMNCDPGKAAKHTVAEWFSYACFAEPASQFAPGTAPAYLSHVRTDGAHDLDGTIAKKLSLGEGRALRLEMSAYNITNSVQKGYPGVFWNPSPTPANMAGFGQITGDTNTPRQFQFAAKFLF